jgi:hypothetical protein
MGKKKNQKKEQEAKSKFAASIFSANTFIGNIVSALLLPQQSGFFKLRENRTNRMKGEQVTRR